MAAFTPPTAGVTLGGLHFTMKADLRAFMRIHELLATDPWRFVEVHRPDSDDPALRVEMTPANAPVYFAAFCDKPANWEVVCADAHPLEVVRAWATCSELLSEVEEDWQPEGEAPFCAEPE